MLEVKNAVKTFDGFRALDGLTMTVPKGAVYGLVGPNGAGKSTIIRHLAGIYRQDSGEVLLDSQPVYENTAMTYFPSGEAKFEELLRQLETAEKYIFVEYFIIDEGVRQKVSDYVFEGELRALWRSSVNSCALGRAPRLVNLRAAKCFLVVQ